VKLVILDRDGVINEDSDSYIKSDAEWIPLEGSIEAIAKLSKAGFTIVVATNQSGLSRKLFDLDDLEAMHEKMNYLIKKAGGKLNGVFFCPHHPDDNCQCRKPKTGLIDAIEKELSTTAAGAYFVGDSLRDIESAIAKHCKPILVRTGNGEKTLKELNSEQSGKERGDIKMEQLAVFNDLAAASNFIIKTH
jgi:D-glycero-D-manno-heptose 1,7-bisphosphate phosphatase